MGKKMLTKEIKIVEIRSINKEEFESKLGQLVNEGWVIICGCGGSGQNDPEGFIVLQRDKN